MKVNDVTKKEKPSVLRTPSKSREVVARSIVASNKKQKDKKENFLSKFDGDKQFTVEEEKPEKFPENKLVQEAPSKEIDGPNVKRKKWAMKLVETRTPREIAKDFNATCRKIKASEYSHKAFDDHYDKNRYNDVLCMDSTRVVLKDRPPENDYIHASWITMPNGAKYICTQGPLDETIEDFWHMVFSEKSNVVVMVCRFEEENNSKCARYFIDQINAQCKFGIYSVTLKEVKQELFPTVTWRRIEVEKNGEKQMVNHYSIPTWPDHTSPDSPGPAVSMHREAKDKAAGAPIVVHCSAGIGRSATFIGIEHANQKIKAEARYSLLTTVKDLRQSRAQAIQTPVQYLFLYMCQIELFLQENVLTRTAKVEEFYKKFNDLLKSFNKKMAKQLADKASKHLIEQEKLSHVVKAQ